MSASLQLVVWIGGYWWFGGLLGASLRQLPSRIGGLDWWFGGLVVQEGFPIWTKGVKSKSKPPIPPNEKSV